MNDDAKPGKSEAGSSGSGKGERPKDLNDVLASWDDSGESESGKNGKTDNAILSEIADLRMQMELPGYVKAVQGDTGLDDELATGLISEALRNDSKFASLWDKRHSNKAEFNEALNALNAKAKEKVEKLRGSKSDKSDKPSDELAAAVRSARESGSGSGSELDSVNFGNLSDAELAIKKAEVFRLARAGELK